MNIGQWVTLLEKSRYPFRNYPTAPCHTLLFPGCSFPSQFPATMTALVNLCRQHGVGVAYDCCGKPVAELERGKSAVRIAREISHQLTRLGVGEVVCLCPNCMEYLEKNLKLPVISVYALLARWAVDRRRPPLSGVVFRPCPDRQDGRTLGEIAALLPLEQLRPLERIPCCGLRGDIAAHGPQAGDRLCALVREQTAGETIYTYCASCSGQFQRHSCGQVRHLLSALLGIEEAPDSSRSLWNRAHTKFKK